MASILALAIVIMTTRVLEHGLNKGFLSFFFLILSIFVCTLITLGLITVFIFMLLRFLRGGFLYELTAEGIKTVNLFGKTQFLSWGKFKAISVQIIQDTDSGRRHRIQKKREHLVFHPLDEKQRQKSTPIQIREDEISISIEQLASHLMLIPDAASLTDETVTNYKSPTFSFWNRNAAIVNFLILPLVFLTAIGIMLLMRFF
ncbi:MAG: hypothetical protein IT287_00205, partial [Bdellovibrionaceae bacterium]|nr:hypothetical protein [Pseudobdellovibrionaceae bacterium]